MHKDTRNALLYILLPIAISFIIILNFDYIRSINWKAWGPVGIFLAMLITSSTLFLPLPTIAIATIGGYYFDPLMIGLISGLGGAIGELTGYMIGYGSSKILKENERYQKLAEKIRGKKAFATILIMAAIPNPLFDAAGIVAGAIKYPWWAFLIATTIGKILKYVLFAYLGLAFTLV